MVGLHGEAGCYGQRLTGDGWVSPAIVVAFGDAKSESVTLDDV